MWSIPTAPRSELAWAPAGVWVGVAFLTVLGATLLEGRVPEPVRWAPVVAVGLGLLPVGGVIRALRREVALELVADEDGLTARIGPGWLAHHRASEAWPAPVGCTWSDGALFVPWTHPAFAKLRAPQAAHFLDGWVRVGFAIRIRAWVPVEEGLTFLTRCRHLCLRRLGGGQAVDRELDRLERVDSGHANRLPDASGVA